MMWVLDYAPRVLEIYEKAFPKDHRLRQGLGNARAWSVGKVKMLFAKKVILDIHKAAREAEEKPWHKELLQLTFKHMPSGLYPAVVKRLILLKKILLMNILLGSFQFSIFKRI